MACLTTTAVVALWLSTSPVTAARSVFTTGVRPSWPLFGFELVASPVVTLVVYVAVTALLGWLWWAVVRWTIRPLSAVTAAVAQFGPHNLGQRLRQPGSAADPLKRLADTIDDVLDRLAAGFDGQRRFAANASHELRTPLAVQRMLVELALEASKDKELHRLGGQLLLANERNERLIEGLLALAESDRGLTGHVPVRLDELVVSVLETHAELAAQHQVTLEREGSEMTVPGDPVLLERLIVNLVRNAITYNQPDGAVRVLVESGRLVVRNTGERVPAEAVPALFEPFRRLTRDRTVCRLYTSRACPSCVPSPPRTVAR